MKVEMARNQHHEMDNEFVIRSHRLSEAEHQSYKLCTNYLHCILSIHLVSAEQLVETTRREHMQQLTKDSVNIETTRLHDLATHRNTCHM